MTIDSIDVMQKIIAFTKDFRESPNRKTLPETLKEISQFCLNQADSNDITNFKTPSRGHEIKLERRNMEIQGRKLDIDVDYLSPVTYIPSYAEGNAGHEDCKQGVIISFNNENETVRVLYSNTRTVQGTESCDLVWG